MSLPLPQHEESLRVAFTPDGLSRPHGGVKRYAEELLTRFQQIGLDVSITGGGLPRGSMPRRLRIVTSHIREAIRPSNVDVIFCPFVDVPVRTRRSTPIVATIHDLTGLRYPRDSVAGYLSRRSLRRTIDRADHLICVSVATQADLIAYGVDRQRTTVVPQGVDTRFFRAPSPEHTQPRSTCRSLQRDRRTLLYVGKRRGYKDFNLLPHALQNSSFGHEPVELWIVGGEPLRGAELTNLINNPGIERVRNFGNISDAELVRLYQSADACVITSRYEGFGLPALEAMAAGCPLASSTGGSLAEVVEGRAFTFAPGLVADCASALTAALSASADAPELLAGRSFARLHTWQRTAEETVAIVQNVYARGGR